MMTGKLVLCLDESAVMLPETIGLDGESLESRQWLEVLSSGEEVRAFVSSDEGVDEVWVYSCDDIEPINLAAAIKADCPELHVSLVVTERCGSLLSRAHTAQIDEVIERRSFPRRYAQEKGRRHLAASPQAVASTIALIDREEGLQQPLVGLQMTELRNQPVEPALLYPQMTSLPQSSTRAFILTVVSGSGGAGKSAVSALGSIVACNLGYRTLLLDCDLQFGDVAAMVGASEALRLDDAFMRPELLERELARDEQYCVIAAPARLESAEEIALGVPRLLEMLAGSFDVIVVNTGALWAEQHAALLERSSAALFLIDQRASSVGACRHALELCARCGIATGSFQFALNRCAKSAPLSSIDVSCALQGALVYELKDGGADVEACLSDGAAAELVEARNEFAKSLERVIAQLVPGGDGRPAGASPEKVIRRAVKRRARHAERKRGWRQS